MNRTTVVDNVRVRMRVDGAVGVAVMVGGVPG